jgi:hypothetical protein
LRVLLKLKCEEHHVAQRLVATTGDLEAIAAQERPDVAALQGWRFEVFGRSALAESGRARPRRRRWPDRPDADRRSARIGVRIERGGRQAPRRPTARGQHRLSPGTFLRPARSTSSRSVTTRSIVPDLLDGVDRVISFARHPRLGSADYEPATMDPDLRLGND